MLWLDIFCSFRFFWIGKKLRALSGSMPNNSTPPCVQRLTVIRLNRLAPAFVGKIITNASPVKSGEPSISQCDKQPDFVSFKHQIYLISIFRRLIIYFSQKLLPMIRSREEKNVVVATIIICCLVFALPQIFTYATNIFNDGMMESRGVNSLP